MPANLRLRVTFIRLFAGLLVSLATAHTVWADDIGQGPVVQLRAGHIEGQGIFQYRSITPVELLPYYIMEDSLIYGHLRFFPTNDLELGGNAGVGYRYYAKSLVRIFG